jgi:hypothetical protein
LAADVIRRRTLLITSVLMLWLSEGASCRPYPVCNASSAKPTGQKQKLAINGWIDPTRSLWYKLSRRQHKTRTERSVGGARKSRPEEDRENDQTTL